MPYDLIAEKLNKVVWKPGKSIFWRKICVHKSRVFARSNYKEILFKKCHLVSIKRVQSEAFWNWPPLDCSLSIQNGDDKPCFLWIFYNVRIRVDFWNCIPCNPKTLPIEYCLNFSFPFINGFTINEKLWKCPIIGLCPKPVPKRYKLYRSLSSFRSP